MSISTPHAKLSEKTRKQINNDLTIRLENSKYAVGMPPKYIFPFDLHDGRIVMPFAYAARGIRSTRPPRERFSGMQQKFGGGLRDEQKVVRREAIDLLSRTGSVMISCFPGFGKTCCAINLACHIRLRTLVVVNKIVLMSQWEASIHKFAPLAQVQIVTPKSTLDEDVDFYIMNAMNIEKMGHGFFHTVGLVVVDEAHLIVAETLSRSLQFISPRYLIGLTATPYRPDGLNVLLDLYFGTDKIIRELYREHTVYRVETGFTPKMELTAAGKVNWNSVLESQAEDEDRNQLILRIIKHFSDRVFLLLTKRVAQAKYLAQQLEEAGVTVTSLIGSEQQYDSAARVLVGTTNKVGVGFDHPALNTLLLAADVEEYFIQVLGRIFRREDTVPMVFDLVDRNGILKKHFNTRKSVYLSHGGAIETLDMDELEGGGPRRLLR